MNLPVKLIVTGSSSLEIKSRIFESLAGRKRVFNIWPFSFKEYLRVCAPELLDLIDERNISHINKKKILEHYFTNIRKELTKMPKIYFADNGLRNFSLKYFANFTDNRDKGPLLENFVFSSLIKCWEGGINYWRTKDKNEVDFILSDYYGNVIPIEVKATELRKIEIGSGIRSFIDRYSPKNAFIINLSLEEKVKHNRTHIHFLLPYRMKNLIKEIG